MFKFLTSENHGFMNLTSKNAGCLTRQTPSAFLCLSTQLGIGQSNTRSLQVDASKSVAKIQQKMLLY